MTVPLEPGFFLHRSNRTERLLEHLVEVVRRPAGVDPLARECIVVQGQGMGRWLSMSLSRRLGAWARPWFPVMRELLEGCADGLVGPSRPGGFYEPDTLAFAIADAIGPLTAEPGFERVAAYLANDEGGRRRVQLAERLAQVFDGYAVHRPDWLAAWAAGRAAPGLGADETAAWQARLWQALRGRTDARSHDERMLASIDALAREAGEADAIPPRICVFGLSTIAPLHVHVLAALARSVPVHVFLLTPTEGWWADLRPLREQWRAAARGQGPVAPGADARAAVEGHPLLAAFGRLGRDFQQTLESHVDYVEPGPSGPGASSFVDPTDGVARPTLLRRLQARMLRWEEGGARGAGDAISPDTDASVRIHVCHSAQREIEVLHDQLTGLFERDPTLEPDDVVVMSPDIERHAPLVDAVFASRTAGSGAARIPHRVADRSIVVTREAVAAFLELLDVIPGRLSAAPVLDLLATPSVARRHGLDAEAISRLEAWVERAGIRWGLDASQRVDEGQPDDDLHTWRYGLDRLLLGVAMEPDPTGPWQGRLPVGGIEGEDARLVGVLASFVDDLAWARARVRRPHAPAEWAVLLRELAARFVAETEDNAHHHQALRDAFEELRARARDAGCALELGLPAVRSLLMRSLRASTPSYGFLSGGVTFCEMVPMRSIPFRVVCMLGLDDGAFPRIQRRMGFDLMARHPRLGDRSTRDDDRALFLEALLSARDHLVVSYVGRDVRDGEPRPPSVVVSELVDAARDELGVAADASLAGWIVEHPLKAFSPRYFEGGSGANAGLESWDDRALRGARAILEPKDAPPPFVAREDRSLPAGDVPERLELSELIDFLRHASRRWLRDALGVRVDSPEAPERDREPAGLDPLAHWQVGDDLLRALQAGEDAGGLRARLRAAGALPPGALGERWLDDVALEARRLFERQQELAGDAPLGCVDVDLEVGGVRLVGRVDGLVDRARIRCGFAKLGGTSELDAWVEHLALCATMAPGTAFETLLIGRLEDTTSLVRFGRVERAREHLAELVGIWRAGRTRPVPFFPKSARAYASKLARAGDEVDESVEEQATLDAYRTYRGDDSGYDADRSELEREADIRFVWRGADPLADARRAERSGAGEEAHFRALALAVYGPMLAARMEES